MRKKHSFKDYISLLTFLIQVKKVIFYSVGERQQSVLEATGWKNQEIEVLKSWLTLKGKVSRKLSNLDIYVGL